MHIFILKIFKRAAKLEASMIMDFMIVYTTVVFGGIIDESL